MPAINEFVKHFTRLKYEDLPAAAVQAAKKEVLDSLATALGGSSKAGVGELVDMIKEWGGTQQSTVIAYGFKCPAPNAAQVNGTMIHALDYDDGHQVALVHIGCVAVSTAFATADGQSQRQGVHHGYRARRRLHGPAGTGQQAGVERLGFRLAPDHAVRFPG